MIVRMSDARMLTGVELLMNSGQIGVNGSSGSRARAVSLRAAKSSRRFSREASLMSAATVLDTRSSANLRSSRSAASNLPVMRTPSFLSDRRSNVAFRPTS